MILALNNGAAVVRTDRVSGARIKALAGNQRHIDISLSHSVPMHVCYADSDDGRELADADWRRLVDAMGARHAEQGEPPWMSTGGGA